MLASELPASREESNIATFSATPRLQAVYHQRVQRVGIVWRHFRRAIAGSGALRGVFFGKRPQQ